MRLRWNFHKLKTCSQWFWKFKQVKHLLAGLPGVALLRAYCKTFFWLRWNFHNLVYACSQWFWKFKNCTSWNIRCCPTWKRLQKQGYKTLMGLLVDILNLSSHTWTFFLSMADIYRAVSNVVTGATSSTWTTMSSGNPIYHEMTSVGPCPM